jgi:hypothetical protein
MSGEESHGQSIPATEFGMFYLNFADFMETFDKPSSTPTKGVSFESRTLLWKRPVKYSGELNFHSLQTVTFCDV